MYTGQTLRLTRLADGLVELIFDRQGSEVNTLDTRAVDEFAAATRVLAATADLRGVLISSAKQAFVVGADIFEFRTLFAKPVAEIARYNAAQSAVFSAFEALPVPSVALIGGLALGGGFELALAADLRVLDEATRVGLPEVALGLFPGFGGTARLPRLCGAGTALEWITSGKPRTAAEALACGAVDAIAPAATLRAVALERLAATLAGGDWRARRRERAGPVRVLDPERVASLRAQAQAVADRTPAALAAVELIAGAAALDRDAALARESQAFAAIAVTPAARALVQVFVNEQALKRSARRHARSASPARRAAVLGAGIMGGGIAYASAVRGVPVLLKDIAQGPLDVGQREARALLAKQQRSGRIDATQATAIDASIVPTLEYAEFHAVDVVVEAIVEDLAVKRRVLAEVERHVAPSAVLASNTSSLSIDELAGALARPERFVGMHFFNPVPVMPLVEVIRGRRSGEEAVGAAVAYALAMGKTPIVLRDCPGFLVNRILNAYFVGFSLAIHDGADFERLDASLQAWGWPMGPAYLQDVVGMDVSSHVFELIAAAYPQRMSLPFENPMRAFARQGRYGQKSGVGFYRHERGADGRMTRRPAEDARALLAAIQPRGSQAFDDATLVERLMIPMILEAATCLIEGVAESAGEIDMALVLGLGFPRHRGGPLAYADALGLEALESACERLAPLGAAYRLTDAIRERVRGGRGFYG